VKGARGGMIANLERRLAGLEAASPCPPPKARAIMTEEDLLSLKPDELPDFSNTPELLLRRVHEAFMEEKRALRDDI